MAAKRSKNNSPEVLHYCGDCGCGTWDMKPENRDVYAGRPICVICSESGAMRVRSQKACDKWKPRTPEELSWKPNNKTN